MVARELGTTARLVRLVDLVEPCRILVVEDEIFVAIEVEHIIGEMGLCPVGIAADAHSAIKLADECDVALVDLNLRDGPTGVKIARELIASRGATVLFMTANPTQIDEAGAGALGVIAKPVADSELRASIAYAAAVHRGEAPDLMPSCIRPLPSGATRRSAA